MATDCNQMREMFARNPDYIPGIEDSNQDNGKKVIATGIQPESKRKDAVMQYQAVSINRQASSKVRPSAIFSGQSIDAKRPIFERLIGISLLVLSFVCTVMTFNGAWGKPSIKALSIGISLQLLATVAEWFWRNQRMSIWYMGAIVFDAGMSIKGFSIPLLEPFQRLAATINTSESVKALQANTIAAWVVIGILSIALAVLPEVILIDKD